MLYRLRRKFEDLLKNTPADGLVAGNSNIHSTNSLRAKPHMSMTLPHSVIFHVDVPCCFFHSYFAGIGSVNGKLFPDASQCIALSYDYMVLAGTQGIQNHRKTDRMFEMAETLKLPIVFLCEGGGGRPGDTDSHGIAGLDCMAFTLYSKLSGVVPRIGEWYCCVLVGVSSPQDSQYHHNVL